MNGIQEVSGSIPLISTKQTTKPTLRGLFFAKEKRETGYLDRKALDELQEWSSPKAFFVSRIVLFSTSIGGQSSGKQLRLSGISIAA